MNLKGFKKVSDDKDKAVLQNQKGHSITIAKKSLSAHHLDGLNKLPLYAAEGTEVKDPTAGLVPDETQNSTPIPPEEVQAEKQAQAPQEDDHQGMLHDTGKFIGKHLIGGIVEGIKGVGQAADYAQKTAAPFVSGLSEGAIPEDNKVPDQAPQDPTQGLAPQQPLAQNQAPADNTQPQGDQAPQTPPTQPMAQPQQPQAAPQDALSSQLLQNNKDYQSITARQVDADATFQKAMQDGKIDPNRLYSNQSTGQKIVNAIRLFLGGLGGGLGGRENPVLKEMNRRIDMDVDAQKNNLQTKFNLYKMHKDSLQDQAQATLQTGINLRQAAMAQADEQMGKIGNTPMAMLQHQALKAQLGQQIQQAQYEMGMMKYRKALLNGQTSAKDPSQLVQFMVPEAHQKDVFNEIKQAQTATGSEQELLKDFDQAAKDVRITKGGNPLYATFAQSPSVKSLNALEDPLLHDAEGRISDKAKADIVALHPQVGDRDSTIATKRRAYQNFINYKKSAPTAKGFGIDLSKFPSTATSPQQDPLEGKIAVDSKGNRIIRKNGNWMPYAK